MPGTPVLLGQDQPVVREEKLDYTSAFLLLVGDDGSFSLEPDINKPITTQRKATPHEIKGALYTVLSELNNSECAMMATQLIMMNMSMQAARMQDAMQNQQIMSKVNLK